MQAELRLYKAIVWEHEDSLGQRIEIFAENLNDAEFQLKGRYGEKAIYTLHNEEDANRPR